MRLCQSRLSRRLYVAGVGAGKSHGLVLLALLETIAQPGVPGAILCPTFRLFRDVVLPAWQKIVPSALYTWCASTGTIEMANGTRIYCRGCDQPEKRIIGLEVGWIVMDEAGQLRTVRAVQMAMQRLRIGDPARRFLALFTSPHGHGWLQEWSVQPGTHVERATTYDNPFLPAEYLADLEQEFPPGTLLHRQELLGEFVSLAGLLYGELWDDEQHLAPVRYDPRLPYELGVDFGFRASAWVAMQRQGARWCAVREWLPDGEFTEVSIARIREEMGAAPALAECDTPTRANTRTGMSDVEAIRSVCPRTDVRVVAGRRRQSDTRHHALSAALAARRIVFADHLSPRRVLGGERGIVHALRTLEWRDESTRLERTDQTDPRKHAVDALEFWAVARLPLELGTSTERAIRLAG